METEPTENNSGSEGSGSVASPDTDSNAHPQSSSERSIAFTAPAASAATPPVRPTPSPSAPRSLLPAPSTAPSSDRRGRLLVAACLIVCGLLLFLSPNYWLIPDPYGDARHVAQVGGTILEVFGVIIAFRRPSLSAAASSVRDAVESGMVMMALGVGIGIVGWLLSREKAYAFLGVAAMAGAGLVGLFGFTRLLFANVRRSR